MKKLTLFVAALCATTMAVNAAETEWEKVTAEPTDWSGDYILVYEKTTKGAPDSAYVWTGADTAFCYKPVVIADKKVTGSDLVSITIASTDKADSLSIIVNGGDNTGKYLGYTGEKNGMNFSDDVIKNAISYDAQSKCVLIKSGTIPSTLAYNANAGTNNSRFRYYKSSQKAVQLYKKVASTVGPTTALENVEALEVYAENGRIYAAEGARIFTVSGIDVTEMNGQLNGIYIVKVGNQATKIAVK